MGQLPGPPYPESPGDDLCFRVSLLLFVDDVIFLCASSGGVLQLTLGYFFFE